LRAEVRALGAQPADTVIAAIRALRDRPDRTAELPEIAAPTLIVVGSDDTLSPLAEARAMAAALPHARVAEIPGAGHLSNLENPDAFAATLAAFP
jgi:3-oxoadipate enol-lactonase